MKIIVLHGDHITKSYLRLTKFIEVAKERGWEIINDDVGVTPSLFGKERLIVIRKENLLTKGVVKNLTRFPGTIVIYHEDTLPQSFLKLLPKETKIEEFALPKIIWQFLDRPTIKVFHQLLKHEPAEFIFAVLAKRCRDLYWVKVDPASLSCQPWQLSRLKNQATKYEPEKLKQIMNRMAEIDVLVKTSKTDLISELDLLLIKHLE